MVTTENLKVGQVVKNYKELCSLMGLEPTTGNSKKTQMKEIDRYIDYKKVDHRFIITEIFKEPIPKEERLAANAKYITYIQPLLLSFLAKQEEQVVYITRPALWETLGMVNHKYRLARKNRESLLGLDEHMSLFDIKNFFMRSASRINGILNPALDRLARRSLISYHEVYMVGIEKMVNSDSGYIDYHEATEDEIRYIITAKRKVLVMLKCEDEIDVMFKGLSDRYYGMVGDILFEEHGWVGVYKCLKIIFNKIDVEEVAEKELKLQLNHLVLEALDKQAESNYNGTYNKGKKPSQIFYYPSTYVDMQKVLSDHLIKIL